jgi:D-lactate dehydrogenase (cytochrome)
LCLARIELLDAVQMQCVNARSGLELDGLPTLFLEFHGSSSACHADFETFEEIAAVHGGRGMASAAGEAARKKLWRARHDAFWSVKATWPGRDVIVTDVAVPLSHLALAVTETAADIQSSGLTAPIVGHVGDGNFHAIVVVDPSDAGEIAAVEAFLERLVTRAQGLDGTATGEHGIGQGKSRYMAAEHASGLAVMRAIKQALDPFEIFNPDKMF